MNPEKDLLGLVFNIQRFSIHDGPGIRTTVFLKGCNLKCFWCHNPESINPKIQMQFFKDKCIYCGACLECENSAHSFYIDDEKRNHVYDPTKCVCCGSCMDKCYSKAIDIAGKYYDVDSVFYEIMKDKSFYGDDGGVTFSGGEPLLQADFVAEVAKKCKEAGITVAIDTAGNVPYSSIEKVLPYADYFLFDVKHADSQKHFEVTGVHNERIQENLGKLLTTNVKVRIRVPLIPTVNYDENSVKAIAQTVADRLKESGGKIDKFEFMPFHGIAVGKYHSLSLDYKAEGFEPPEKSLIEKYYQIVREYISWNE